jgi:hypothetical protein
LLHAQQADIEAGPKEAGSVRQTQIDFGVDANSSRQRDIVFASLKRDGPYQDADQPAASSCSGFAPMLAEPGIESLMSRTPSELRETPLLRPPAVWVLAVYRTSTFWLMAHSL